MKYFIAVLACVAVASAQSIFKNNYRPLQQPQFRYSTPRPTIAAVPVFATQAPVAYSVPVAAKAYNGDARSANIVKLENDISPDGSFTSYYETDNGIAAQAQGTPRVFNTNPPVAPVVIQGSFSWTSPEGQPIAISYVADENGYRAEGSAIPVAPPVPAQIARALAYTAQYAAPQK